MTPAMEPPSKPENSTMRIVHHTDINNFIRKMKLTFPIKSTNFTTNPIKLAAEQSKIALSHRVIDARLRRCNDINLYFTFRLFLKST